MKTLHWIIFAIAGWLVTVPFVGDDLISLILRSNIPSEDIINLLRWDDFFLGAGIMILALIVLTMEQASHKTPGLKAMHYLQVVLGFWIMIAPFALTFDYAAFTWSHFVSGTLVAIFALLQITHEHNRKN